MTMRHPVHHPAMPQDQAHGLRRMFAATRQRFVPLVHNPYVTYGGIAMERLCAAYGERHLHTLVVDAADTASAPHELTRVDLSACIEPLSDSVSFLAARGLPMRWLEANGSTAGFLAALADAAPQADVVLLHGSATDLGRLFAGRKPRPVLLAADHPQSLTHAYASMKLLAQRLGVLAFDLLLAAEGESARMRRIAESLSGCADRFLGAAVGEWAVADPSSADAEFLDHAMRRLAAAQLGQADEGAGWRHPAAHAAPAATMAHAN